jgi:CRP-like cAMP-binding protein
MQPICPSPRSNRLLCVLSPADYDLLAPHLAPARIAQGDVLIDAGDTTTQVVFPLSGFVSVVVVLRNNAVETATIGRDGVIGAMSAFGFSKSRVRAVAQSPMFASKISSTEFGKAVAVSKPIADLCLTYNEVQFAQALVSAACHASHSVEARFSRWLLRARDLTESDTIFLTQALLSDMLGVRRTSVTEAARRVQAAGAISYSRGVIKIIDLGKLKATACECYDRWRP